MARLALASLLAIAEATTLGLTYEDCGAKHGVVTGLSPLAVEVGSSVTVTGTGTVDEDVTSGHFTATVSVLGAKLAECSGDGTSDIVCSLPMGVAKVTLKALSFPLPKGAVSIPVEVTTSPGLPKSLLNVDIHVTGEEQHGESAICLDVHTAPQMEHPPQPQFAEAVILGLTYEDCGAKHGVVTGLSPLAVEVGSTVIVTGTGTVDEDVTSGHFTATVSALGTKITECSGDGTSDIVCSLPMGVGKVTLKALSFPLPKGAISIPVEVTTSPGLPKSLLNVDIHVTGEEQNGESAICLNVHTAPQMEHPPQPQFAEGVILGLTYKDCGAKHGVVTGLSPLAVEVGSSVTVTGTGTVDEDVTSGHFTATVSVLGAKLAECSGDGTSDIVCSLPLGVARVTLKALSFPLAKGAISIPVEVTTSPNLDKSLLHVDIHVTGQEQNGESAICLDVHTAPQTELVV